MAIAAIPLGGYVKMRGDDDAASTPASHAIDQSGCFAGASLYWHMAIVAQGLRLILFWVLPFSQRFIYSLTTKLPQL